MTEPAHRFEDRLLLDLLDDLPPATGPDPAPAGTRRRLLFGAGALGAVVAAAVAGLLVVTATGPAYAIDARPDGSFAVVLSSTDPADLADAQSDLVRRGAEIRLAPRTVECLGILDARPLASPPHPLPDGPPSATNHPELFAFRPVVDEQGVRRNPITGRALKSREWAFIVEPSLIPAGQVLWVAVAGGGRQVSTLLLVSQFAARDAAEPDFCAG